EGLQLGRNAFSISNYGYNIVRLAPLLLLVFKGFRRNVFLILSFAFVFISFKRGAILTYGVLIVVLILHEVYTIRSFRAFLKASTVFSIVLILITTLLIQYGDIFLSRMRDFESLDSLGSGRVRLYTLILT